MAEAVGLVTGLASLAISITEGVAKLRDLYKESKTNSQEVESLMRNLEFLTLSVKGLEGLSTLDDQNLSVLIDHCRKDVQDVASSLQEMTDTLNASEKRPRKALSRMKWLNKNKKSIEKLKGLTEAAKSKIGIVFLYGHPTSSQSPPVMLPHSTTQQVITTERDQGQPDQAGPIRVITQSTASSSTLAVRPDRYRRRRVDCTRRACSCTCHIKGQITSRFWQFEYSPLSFILNGCSNPDCTATEYVSELRVALTQLGWHRAITFGFKLGCASGAYFIRPSLEIKEEVVRYTSRGFELLMRLNKGFSDWREVVQEFREMYQQDKRIIKHVNPEGRGYIGELLWWSNDLVDWESTLHVLEVFMSEFKMSIGLDDIKQVFLTSFLYRMAHMIGEGPHLSIFEELLALEFDPSDLPNPAAEKWPEPCNPNWRSEKFTPDPFFLELLAMMVSVDPDFGGTSPLQREILCGSADSVAELLDRGTCNDESNFLGQKALHLAVFSPECAHVLISAGYSINVTDKNGTTPLMYACAMGRVNLAKLLISNGAKLGATDKLRDRDSLGYALARGHYRLAFDLALYYQGNFPEDAEVIGTYFARTIALFMCSFGGIHACWDEEFCFQDLLGLGSKLDFTFSDSHHGTKDNNLMHYPVGLTNAKALIAHGFTGLDQKNSDGITPIMECIPYYPETMDILIEHGVDVSARDLCGKTPMHYAVDKWQSSDPYSADEKQMDRRARFDEMEMTHTCCSNGTGNWGRLRSFMSNSSSLSEEDEATVMWEQCDRITQLESQISRLKTESYQELRGVWLQQLRQSHNHYLRRYNLPVWEEVLRQSMVPKRIPPRKVDSGYSINFQKDKFEFPPHGGNSLYCGAFWREKKDEIDAPIQQMVRLLWALEENFAVRRNRNEEFTELERWYYRRLAWVTEILESFSSWLRTDGIRFYERSYGS
ncbi:hypothetical protein E8E14_011618 [Neopestalotiopsis sp. 37M]|nr:hypothetical protein E8E14_011618 [Neopestalotiopsis sp. 37M]